jgi:hypothetical protein
MLSNSEPNRNANSGQDSEKQEKTEPTLAAS